MFYFRLRAAQQRQDQKDKKLGVTTPLSLHFQTQKLNYLEKENQQLNAKVKDYIIIIMN